MIRSQRNSNRRRHVSSRRVGLLSTLGRILIAAGLSSGALVSVAVATQTAASAAGFGPDAFMNLDGSVRYIANATPAPTNKFGWANSGAATPASTCTGSQVGVTGSNGLFDCGAPNPSATDTVPLPPKYIGPAVGTQGILGEMFVTTPDNQAFECGGTAASGAYIFGGGDKWDGGLSTLTYGTGPVTGKDGIADAYLVSRSGSSGGAEVFMGAQRTIGNGDSHVDFQFLQDSVATTGSCSGGFTGSREQGDVMVSMDYVNGGGTQAPTIYQWTCTAQPSAPGTKCDTTGTWVTTNVGSAAAQNSNSSDIPCGGWVCEGSSGPSSIGASEFVEGAIDLGQLNNQHYTFGCTSSVLIETRTSQSGPGQIKSLAKPIAVPTCQPTTTKTVPSSTSLALGGSLHDSVTVAQNFGNTVPSGTVTFYVCSNTTTGCTPANGTKLIGSSPNPATLDNTGKASSPSYTPPSAGNYCFAGVYTPTPGNFFAPSSDTSVDECFTVTPLTPGFTTAPTSTQMTFGGSNTDVATVSGNSIGGIPGGSVQFSLCQVQSGSSTCSGGTKVGSPVSLTPGTGFSATATSPPVSPTPGTWCFTASYTATAGGNYSGVSMETNSDDECFTVAKQGTQTATHVVAANVTFGAGGISDNVSVAPVSNTGPAPTGTVQFYVCETSGTFCTPSPASQDGSAVGLTVPVSGSTSTATSPVFAPTSAGTWCFSAIYSGDNNYLGSQDNTTSANTDSNECVTVGKAPTATTTTVMDVANNGVWGGETAGASAYDTATVAPNPNFANAPTPTGTISYTFFRNGSCSTAAGPGTDAGSHLSLGTKSNNEGPLAAGSYSFQATYSGDSNYAGSTGACEPFTVFQGTSTTGTVVFDAGTNAPWAGTETTGASAYDTSSVTPSSTLVPATGSVSYTFFSNGSCANTGSAAGGGNLVKGAAPNSNPTGPLGAGSYSFQATYSGDSNYAGSTGPCEQFTVGKGTSQTGTTVFDATTGKAWTNTETTGASAYDTSTVTASFEAIAPTGTITYSFFTTGDCSQHSVAAGGGQLGGSTNSDTEGPLGAGSYSFQATYSGDGNYTGSTGPCEPLTVNQGSSQTATTVFDAATNNAWTGTEVGTPSAYDTSTVTPSSGNIPATGTVSYTFFPNGTCTPDTGTSAGGGSLLDGLAPNSNTEGPLSQGNYSFQAVYSGDTNYAGSTGSCEKFVLEYAVITAAKSSNPVDGSVVHPGDTVTYTITLSNAGLVPNTGVTVTDAVPAGTTYVASSASDGGTLNGGILTWTGLTVPAQGSKAVSFSVTVNANDTDGQVIPNHAIFPNVNTPQDGCIQSSDTTPQVTATSVQTASSTLCDTNTVTLTVAIPIINVVKSEPTPGNGQTVTAGQSAPITYKLAVTNAGSAVATNVVVTDVIPTGATYVAGSATPSVEATYNSSTKTITWTVPSVPAKSGSTPGEVDLTFQVTVDATDANGSTLTNQAAFTNLHTPNCTAGSTTAVCLTNTVSNPVVTLPPIQTQPAPQVAPTTTVPKHALAFTGLDTRMLTFLAVSLVTVGMMLLMIGRRRRPNN